MRILLAAIFALSPALALAQKKPLPPTPKRFLVWRPGETYADKFLFEGQEIRLIREGGVTVAVTGSDEGKYLAMDLLIMNDSEACFDVQPSEFFVTYEDDKGKQGYAFPLTPEKVADKYKTRVGWGNFLRSFAAGLATTTSTETGSFRINGTNGAAAGTYESTTTAPNVAAQAAAAAANRRAAAEASAANQARQEFFYDEAMKANTVFPTEKLSGLVYFERKKVKVFNLNMVINGTAYVFKFHGPSR